MKRRLLAALFSAAIVLTLSISAMAQTTRTFTLSAGDTMTPASQGFDPAGGTMYYGGIVAGQATAGTTGGIFTLSLTFRSIGVVDAANGIYGGLIVSPYSSFVVNQPSGRKTVSTSGSINSGTVTYRLTPQGMADIISVSSTSLTVWEGKNKTRRAVGTGTLDYGTSLVGSGKLTLTF